jgi:hypothetical protein
LLTKSADLGAAPGRRVDTKCLQDLSLEAVSPRNKRDVASSKINLGPPDLDEFAEHATRGNRQALESWFSDLSLGEVLRYGCFNRNLESPDRDVARTRFNVVANELQEQEALQDLKSCSTAEQMAARSDSQLFSL